VKPWDIRRYLRLQCLKLIWLCLSDPPVSRLLQEVQEFQRLFDMEVAA